MDDFKPNNAGGQGATVILPAVEQQNDELKANMELAKAASDARFMAIVAKGAKWAAQKTETPGEIATDEQYGQAVAIVDDMKSTLKSLETIRQEYVGFPTKVISMINTLFRETKKSIEGQKDFLGKLIARRDNEKEKERQAELAKAAELNDGKVETGEDGVGKVQFIDGVGFDKPGAEGRTYIAPISPSDDAVDSTKGASGPQEAKVQEYEIEVLDAVDFMRELVSRSAGKVWLTDHAGEIARFNVEKIKEILRENPTKRKIKGLRIVRL